MKAETVTPTTTPQSVFVLLGSHPEHRICKGILMQAPSTNGSDIEFGDQHQQPFTLAPGANTSFDESTPKNTYLVGDGTDTVSVALVQ
jgi:hypothetical protein